MIQIYKPGNTNFEKNGDMTLLPEEAGVHAVLNGVWTANLTHPIDKDGRWREIEDESVVKMPSFNGEQLFRIQKKTKSEDGVEVEMEPVFMDARDDCFLEDVRPTGKTGQQAINIMTAPNKKYKGHSNISKVSTAYYISKNLIEAINGDDENSFISRWGGEILFDNFDIYIDEKIGLDNGIEVRYGKNIPENGVSEEADFSDVVTRIYPKAYNGRGMTGKYVDSKILDKYPTIKIRTINFEDVKLLEDAGEDEAEGVIVCNTQAELDKALKKKCEEQFEKSIDKPKVTISLEMALLNGTDAYKEYRGIESVSLGDTIYLRHRKLDIVTDARIIELEYDSVKQKVKSVVIGDFKTSYFNNLTSLMNRIDAAINPDGTVVAEQVSGIIDGVRAMMRAQATTASPSPVRATVFEDLVPGSPTYGAMCIGTMGFQVASHRTADGREWDWRTFGTGQGFFADLIVAGTMLGDRIKGGTIGIGGTDTGRDGKIEVKDAKDNLIGKWDINGIDILKGLIRGGKIQSTNYIDGNQGTLIDLEKSEIVVYGTASIDGRDDKYKIIINDSGITAVGKMFEMRLNNQGLVVFDSENRNNFMQMIVSGNDNRESVILMKNENKYMRISQNGIIFADAEGSTIKPPGTVIDPKFIDVKELRANGNAGKTGTAQFSDGSYLRFINGILVDGYTSSGGGL